MLELYKEENSGRKISSAPAISEQRGSDTMSDPPIDPKLALVAAKHDITDAGLRLLEVVTRPECRTMTITKQCELADISRGTYYNLFRDPGFKAAYTELCQTMLLAGAAPASMALNAQAAMGDTAAIKMLLELAGIYQPTARVEHTHTHEAGPSLKEILSRRQP